MGQRIAAQNERSLTTTVSDIEHIESQSLAGITVIKVFFQPTANIQTAIAQVVAIGADRSCASCRRGSRRRWSSSTRRRASRSSSSACRARRCPSRPCSTPRSTCCGRSSITIPGVAIPFPYGGKNRLISVDLDIAGAAGARPGAGRRRQRRSTLQNLILPSGTAKFGDTEYTVRMNGSPDAIAGLNDLPVRTARRRDHLPARRRLRARRLLAADQHRARRTAQRGVLLSVLKNGGASTLDIVDNLQRDAAAASQAHAAGRHQGDAAVRPVGVRARRRSRAWSPRR